MKQLSRKYYFGALLTLIVGNHNDLIASGDRSNVRGMGMARTYVAASRGLDAVGINPANLALPDNGTVTLSIAPVGVHVGSDFLTYNLYSSYFTGVQTDSGRVSRTLNEADKMRILSSFKGNVGEVSVDVSARLVGASARFNGFGAIAATVTDQLAGFVRLPKGYVDFVLNGNLPGSMYDFSGAQVSAWWLREYALSYGGALPKVPFLQWGAAGISIKVVHGFKYYEIERFDATMTTSTNGTLSGTFGFVERGAGTNAAGDGNFQLFGTPVGRGYGVDLGISGGITDFLTFGISVSDIGSIAWSSQISGKFVDTIIVIDDPATLQGNTVFEDALKGKEIQHDPFSTSLPTTFRFGLAVEVTKIPVLKVLPGEMLIAVDYNQGIADAPGSTITPRFSVGVEYKLVRWLPLRSGISFGGTDKKNVALGLGLHLGFFDLDFASENIEWLFGSKEVSYGSVAIGTRFRF